MTVNTEVATMDYTCMNCAQQMEGPTLESVPYRALPGVVLVNVPVWTCPSCGEREVGIPRLNELQDVLAHAVALRPGHLKPEEIRFLRKHLGWSGRDFAAAFDVTPETVSRWENGDRTMGSAAERLLRMCATRLEPVTDYTEVESLLHAPSQEAGEAPMRVELSPDTGWQAAA